MWHEAAKKNRIWPPHEENHSYTPGKTYVTLKWGGLANADVIRGVAQCRQLLTGGGGVKFAKILLMSYVNAPLVGSYLADTANQDI